MQTLNKKQIYRNYFLLLSEGILFTIGIVFFDANTILPLLIKKLTGSAIMVGFIGTAPALGMGITSLFAGNWVKSYQYKKKFFLLFSSVGRIPLWILGLSLIFLSTENVLFWSFLIIGLQFLFWFADGAVYTAWADIIGKTISPDKRGRFLALMQMIAGILSVFAGGFIKTILSLEILEFPGNYGLILCIGAFLFTLSVLVVWGVVEIPSSITKREKSRDLIKLLPQYFKANKPFSISMGVLFLCSLTTISLPFYITFAQTNYNLANGDVGILISSQIIGRMLGGLLLGLIGDKYGHEKAIIGYSIAGLIPPLLALLVALTILKINPLIIFSIIYFFLGMFAGGGSSFMNYMIDLIAEDQRTLYAGLINVVKMPAAIAPVLGGIMVSILGYLPIFIIAIFFSILGIILSLKLPAADRTQMNNLS